MAVWRFIWYFIVAVLCFFYFLSVFRSYNVCSVSWCMNWRLVMIQMLLLCGCAHSWSPVSPDMRQHIVGRRSWLAQASVPLLSWQPLYCDVGEKGTGWAKNSRQSLTVSTAILQIKPNVDCTSWFQTVKEIIQFIEQLNPNVFIRYRFQMCTLWCGFAIIIADCYEDNTELIIVGIRIRAFNAH